MPSRQSVADSAVRTMPTISENSKGAVKQAKTCALIAAINSLARGLLREYDGSNARSNGRELPG